MVKTIAMIYSIHKNQIKSDLEKLSSNERLNLENLLDEKYSEQTERGLECILKRQKELLLKGQRSTASGHAYQILKKMNHTFHIIPEWRK